jgi:hypothetical protein
VGVAIHSMGFGKEVYLETLARKLVREVTVDSSGVCLRPNGKFLPSPMPPGVVGKSKLDLGNMGYC